MGKFTNYLLGGNANPIVGDGYGAVAHPEPSESPSLLQSISTDIRPSSSKSSLSSFHSPSVSNEYFDFGSVNSNGFTSTESDRKHSQFSSTHNMDEPPFDSSQRISRNRVAVKLDRIPDGVRAPKSSVRSSLAPTTTAITLDGSPRPSTESFHSAAEQPSPVETPQRVEELPWQNYEIPEELGLVKDDTPRQIRNIIQESLDENRALRASRMQAPAMEKITPHTKAGTVVNNVSLVLAENSAMASMRSFSSSESVTNSSTSSLGTSQGSETTVESGVETDGLVKPPSNLHMAISVNDSRGSLAMEQVYSPTSRTRMTDLDKKFQESRLRTEKGYRMFRSLPHRKMRDEPTPPLLIPEPAVSECISCFDDIPNKKAVDVPCGHKYCSGCFQQLVSTAILSQDTFPPKCCLSEVPAKTIRRHLPIKAMTKYDEKALEYAVPVANRYYCAVPQCARWIDTRIANRTNGALQCPHCRKNVCTVCRGPQHPSNEDCPQDFGLDRTLEQAERAGWRRCFNCRALVELNMGCRHITCKCKAEFCYTCGLRWRTCTCTEADQARREIQLRERQTQFEADQRAEEEEVRAAIAAVEQAEREIQQEREAEEARVEGEAREIERLEQQRLSDVGDYYQYLRSVLERVRLHQRQAIEKRHSRAWEGIDRIREDLQSPEKVAERERTAKTERDRIIASNDTTIRNLQGKHAIAMKETITRHREAERYLMEAPLDGPEVDAEFLRLETYEQLMQAQKLERQTLKSQQALEIQKWRTRGRKDLDEVYCKSLILQNHLKYLEEITKLERELKAKVIAEGKWFDLLFSQRISMLSEDERRMMRSGAEPPAAPRRSTVIMPVIEVALPAPIPASPPSRPAPIPAASPSPRGEPTARSLREQLGLPMRPEAHQDLHRGVNRRGRIFEPDWEELRQITSSNVREVNGMRASWKRPGVGSTIRVG
ncbi:hypothetical protein N7G274_000696 [Stereocaulon virgatum]|uniref:RBR-type E3 ubiquitin transferase n=1 Tax=Stereocaulon virgatum TaxID=373712 RepID=A0ABR4API8_9LECA